MDESSFLKQAAPAVFMVRPRHFSANQETLSSNAFQHSAQVENKLVQSKALIEFNQVVEDFREKGIEVFVFDDSDLPIKPDAVFPNNWIALMDDGTVAYFPMMAENRRWERRKEFVKELQDLHSYSVKKELDYASYEEKEQFVEGTGSMVIDFVNRVAYANRSPRTHDDLLKKVCNDLALEPVIFDASDDLDKPVYHTNVIMSIGAGFAIICLDSIRDKKERKQVEDKLSEGGFEVINISMEQVSYFCGNCLQLRNAQNELYLAMSITARDHFTSDQIKTLQKHTQLLPVEVSTIQHYGGGGVRCMLTAIHLPQ